MEQAIKTVKFLAITTLSIPFLCLIGVIILFNYDTDGTITYNIQDIDIKDKYDEIFDFFPKDIEKANVKNFVAWYYKGFAVNQYFLELKFSNENFTEELLRIENFSIEKHLETRVLDYDKNCNLFNYPTYICNYWSGKEYQYVCIDNENRTIAYVYVYQAPVEDILFDTKYLPKNFVINGDSKTKDNLYGGLTVFSDEDEIVWESVLNNA